MAFESSVRLSRVSMSRTEGVADVRVQGFLTMGLSKLVGCLLNSVMNHVNGGKLSGTRGDIYIAK